MLSQETFRSACVTISSQGARNCCLPNHVSRCLPRSRDEISVTGDLQAQGAAVACRFHRGQREENNWRPHGTQTKPCIAVAFTPRVTSSGQSAKPQKKNRKTAPNNERGTVSSPSLDPRAPDIEDIEFFGEYQATQATSNMPSRLRQFVLVHILRVAHERLGGVVQASSCSCLRFPVSPKGDTESNSTAETRPSGIVTPIHIWPSPLSLSLPHSPSPPPSAQTKASLLPSCASSLQAVRRMIMLRENSKDSKVFETLNGWINSKKRRVHQRVESLNHRFDLQPGPWRPPA